MARLLTYHMIAFLAGIVLDWIIGDPYWLPHPIRWIGSLISKLTKGMLETLIDKGRNSKKERTRGVLFVLIVVSVVFTITSLVIVGGYIIHPICGMVLEMILTFYILAAKSLYVESMKVLKALQKDGLEAGRKAVSMIVGRDTDCLDAEGVTKAAVETVAENTSDGIIAPLLYTFIGGPILGMTYKAINTMDSMVGYRNDKYINFGRCAARLDDVVNFFPARISAIFMILAAFIGGKNYSGKKAAVIFKRDRYNHKSPNSAQTESVCAGALGIRLAGDASYFGKIVKKPYIGDARRNIEPVDIKRAGVLMFVTEILVIVMCTGIFVGVILALGGPRVYPFEGWVWR